jgi:hypothetical protein
MWLVAGAFWLLFVAYGQHQPPTVLVVVVLAPFLLWVSVFFLNFPQFLIPPGARTQSDIEEIASVKQFPLLWLSVVVGIFGIAALAIWSKHH